MKRFLILCAAAAIGATLSPNRSAYGEVNVRTVINPDGSVQRQFCQPVERTSNKGQLSGQWEKVQVTEEYICAEGTFSSVAAIPDHYERSATWEFPDEMQDIGLEFPPTKLTQRLDHHDYVFVTKHAWQQEMTGGISLQDIPGALEEAKRFFTEYHRNRFKATFGSRYDATPYVEWFETEFMPVYVKQYYLLLDHHLFASATAVGELLYGQTSDLFSRLQAMEENLGERGVLIFDDFPATIIWPMSNDAMIRRFIPVQEQAEAREKFKSFSIEGFYQENYGGEEAFWRAVARLAIRLFGDSIQAASHDVQFRLTWPFPVSLTNGLAQSDNTVLWQPDSGIDNPRGYVMYAIAFVPNVRQQQSLLGEVLISSPESMLRYVEAVMEHTYLQDLLGKSADEGKLLPDAAYYLGDQADRIGLPDRTKWYCQAAGEMYARAANALGNFYDSGITMDRPADIQPDDRAAYVWYSLAESTWSEEMRDHAQKYSQIASEEIASRLAPQDLAQAKQMFKEWTPDKCPWPGQEIKGREH